MPTVKDQLRELSDDWARVSSGVEETKFLSSDIAEKVHSLDLAIVNAIEDSQYHTLEVLDEFRNQVRQTSQEIAAAIQDVGSQHHHGQLVQADAIRRVADSVRSAGWARGALGAAGLAAAGGLIAFAINSASKSKAEVAEEKQLTDDEIKLIAMYEQICEHQSSRADLTPNEIVELVTSDEAGVLDSKKEARRYSALFLAKGILKKTNTDGRLDFMTVEVEDLPIEQLLQRLRR